MGAHCKECSADSQRQGAECQEDLDEEVDELMPCGVHDDVSDLEWVLEDWKGI